MSKIHEVDKNYYVESKLNLKRKLPVQVGHPHE